MCFSERFSVTELEGAASCPFRFFLKRGLGLRPVDERERDKDIWLDPLTRGSELHEIYAALLRRCRDAKRRPNLKTDGAWLRSLAQQRLNDLQQEMPPATTEIFERESKDFLSDVDLFLEGECEDSPCDAGRDRSVFRSAVTTTIWKRWPVRSLSISTLARD